MVIFHKKKVYLVSHKEKTIQFAVKAFSKEALFSQEHGKVFYFFNQKIQNKLFFHKKLLFYYFNKKM